MTRRCPHRPRAARALAVGALAWGVVASSVAACASDGPLAPGLDSRLVGSWATTRESLSPQGSWQRTLTVLPSGRVAQAGVSYGLYPNQSADALSAVATLYGRIDGGPGMFVLQPDSVVTHDVFYGLNHRDVARRLGPGRDTTRFTIAGDVLVLTYFSYPADAPVLATETLYRVRDD